MTDFGTLWAGMCRTFFTKSAEPTLFHARRRPLAPSPGPPSCAPAAGHRFIFFDTVAAIARMGVAMLEAAIYPAFVPFSP